MGGAVTSECNLETALDVLDQSLSKLTVVRNLYVVILLSRNNLFSKKIRLCCTLIKNAFLAYFATLARR